MSDSTSRPKVAVIIPAFNEEKTIGEEVRVIKNAGLVDEIIVVSDGSTDKTAENSRAAGATLVHELPWKHGKGAAMAHGVAHTDAPVIFFLDADLHGLAAKHLELILEPVLSGKSYMTVGLRDRGAFWMWLSQYLPLIGGERALRRDIFDAIPGQYLRGFKVESALNYFCRANKLPYGTVRLTGLTIVRKMQKVGFWRGLKEYIHMFYQVFLAMAEVRLARQAFKSRGTHGKHKH